MTWSGSCWLSWLLKVTVQRASSISTWKDITPEYMHLMWATDCLYGQKDPPSRFVGGTTSALRYLGTFRSRPGIPLYCAPSS